MTKSTRKPQEFEVGKSYRGSGVYNGFGEFSFRAYQKLEADQKEENQMKVLYEAKGFTLYASKKKAKIALRCNVDSASAMHDELIKQFALAISKLLTYKLA